MINITFEKGSENFIFKICDSMFKRVCFFCGKKITKKNIGGAFHKGYFCCSICCLIEYYEKFCKEIINKKEKKKKIND
jgi:hypothetical protein